MSELIKVQFNGDIIEAVMHDGKPWAVVKRICQNLGIDDDAQRAKLSSLAWATTLIIKAVAPDGKEREQFCVDIDTLSMWLATIHPNKVKATVRQSLCLYQRECKRVLAEAFFGSTSAPLSERVQREIGAALDGFRVEQRRALEQVDSALQIATRADQRAAKAEERCEFTDRVARGLALMLQQGAGDGRLGEQRAGHVTGLIKRLADLTGQHYQKINTALRAAMRPAIPQAQEWRHVKVEQLPEVLTWLERQILREEKAAARAGQGGFGF